MKTYVEFETMKPLALYPWLANEDNIYRIWVECDGRKATKERILKRFYKQVAALLQMNDNQVKKLIRY